MQSRIFMPLADTTRNTWLKNFAGKLPLYAEKYGISEEEVEKVKKCADNFDYWLNFHNQLQAFAKSVTAFRKSQSMELGVALSTPSIPDFGTPPEAVPSGIIKYVMSIAHRIKKHIGFTLSDGHDLGLIAAKASNKAGIENLKPQLKLRLTEGGLVEIIWHKPDGIDALEIQVDRSDGNGFVLCDIDTRPNYTDRTPIPKQPASWKYKAIYRKDDKVIGQWSDECKILVGEG